MPGKRSTRRRRSRRSDGLVGVITDRRNISAVGTLSCNRGLWRVEKASPSPGTISGCGSPGTGPRSGSEPISPSSSRPSPAYAISSTASQSRFAACRPRSLAPRSPTGSARSSATSESATAMSCRRSRHWHLRVQQNIVPWSRFDLGNTNQLQELNVDVRTAV